MILAPSSTSLSLSERPPSSCQFSMSLGDDLVIFITSLLLCLLLFIHKSSKAVGGTCGGDW